MVALDFVVEVVLNAHRWADVRLALAVFDADHIILATGAGPRMDGLQMFHPGEPIDGIDLGHVASSNDLFHNPSATPATHALVIDDVGHHECLAASEHLAESGAKVTMVTRLPTLAQDVRSADGRSRVGTLE